MAGLYNNIGKTDSAQIVYHMAIEKARHNPDELRITGPLNNMGMFFNDLENYDSAMVYYQMADNILKAYPGKSDFWKRFHGNVENNLANVFEEWGEYEKVIKYQQENVYLYDSLGSKIGVINASISMANANIELGNYEGQEDLLDRMNRILDALDFPMKPDFNLYIWEVYFKYYRETGDLESAIEYLQKHSHLSDSLQRRKEDLISQSNSQLSTFASEHFKHQLQIEKSEHEKDKQVARSRLWIIILMTLGAIMTPISFYYYSE
jgi:tetratricopeptide (TPR) repeat protein